MPRNAPAFQRDLMISLYEDFGGDEDRVCEAFADAERQGRFFRKTSDYRLSPDEYAREVFAAGIAQGWLERSPRDEQT